MKDLQYLTIACQRWRSHHSIRHSRKPHATRKLHSSMFYRTRVIADQSLHCGNGNFLLFLLLWPWPLNLTHIPLR